MHRPAWLSIGGAGTRARVLSLAALLAGVTLLPATTTNYFTGFEASDGFAAGGALVGRGGWTGQLESQTNSVAASSNGNGIVSGALTGLGQQGFIGRTALGGSYAWLTAARNLALSNTAQVRISVTMQIVDSTNGLRDDFHWEAYNSQGRLLCAVDFDNYNRVVWHSSGINPNYWVQSVPAAYFQRGSNYVLALNLNFASNTWSASLNGVPVVSPTAMMESLVTPDLASVQAVWDASASVYGAGQPGNNYMLFDNFLVSTGTPSQPRLDVVSAGAGKPATLRVKGDEGVAFAIDASTNIGSAAAWSPVGTNAISSGFCNVSDSTAGSRPFRLYRARWLP